MFDQMSLVHAFTKEGLYMGKKTALHLTERDHQRMKVIVHKYIKGLFMHRFDHPVPADWQIKYMWLTPENYAQVESTFSNMNWHTIHPAVFTYGFNYVPDTYQSIWTLAFYGKPTYYAFCIDKAGLERFQAKRVSMAS